MQQQAIAPAGTSYSQALLITNPGRLFFISGQVPENEAGHTPADFRSQCLLAWQQVEKQLKAAGMGLTNLVKVTVYLSHRQYREENSRIRTEVLGAHSPALTIIICGIYEEKWLLEIEGVAAD